MPTLDEAPLETFYAAAAAEFGQAVEREGVVEQVVKFGDVGVRLRFARSPLAELLSDSFARRYEDGGCDVEATISSWEEGGAAARVPWGEAELAPGGLVSGVGAGPVVAVHDTYWGAVTLADLPSRTVLYRVPSPEAVPWWERAAPLRLGLSLALRGKGRHVVHAGAVGDDRGAVLLVGPRGSGKTTVALAAVENGLDFIADDYALLDIGPLATVSSVYSTLSVRGDASDSTKEVVDVDAVRPGVLRGSLPVRGLIAPRTGDGPARLRRISPAAALLAWAPTTALQFPFDDGAVVASLGVVARQVACFALDIGDEPSEMARAVEQVLEQ
jgi:hypothetical protein